MIVVGVFVNFIKIVEVDKVNILKNKMKYERIGDFKVCFFYRMFIIINLIWYNV